jgi:uncharacterized protein (DUF2164 family)
MKDLKHIRRFNESDENLNISDVRSSKKINEMNTIEKIEKGHFNFSEFTEEQINFIKGLVKFSYNDGLEDGKAEIKNKVWNALESDD